jgi:hypothetical protein
MSDINISDKIYREVIKINELESIPEISNFIKRKIDKIINKNMDKTNDKTTKKIVKSKKVIVV